MERPYERKYREAVARIEFAHGAGAITASQRDERLTRVRALRDERAAAWAAFDYRYLTPEQRRLARLRARASRPRKEPTR